MNYRELLKDKKRVVIKVGSSSLIHKETNKLDLRKLEVLVRELSDLHNQGKDVVLVTSGAVAVGASAFGMHEKPTELKKKQACSAVGQARLMMIYQKLFSEYNQMAAQILMTKNTMVNNLNRRNARNTFEELLELGAIPVVNENDSISSYELEMLESFGDNDTLSAVIAGLIGADLLILLSDIDGLFTDDPNTNPDAEFIDTVEVLDEKLLSMGKGPKSKVGTGGMATKLTAAEIATAAGADMVLASGPHRRQDPCAPGHLAGPQARPRRRPRPQHGRHGRLQPGAHGHRRGARDHDRHREARRRRARRRGHHLLRLPLRRLHAHQGRPEGPRVQRPLRRPRDPGRAAPHERRPRRVLPRVRRRHPQPGHGLVGRRLGRLRRAHERRLPRLLREGQAHHRHRRRKRHGRRDRLPRGHQARRGRRRVHQRRPRARRHGRGPHVRGRSQQGVRGVRQDLLRGQDVPPRHRHQGDQGPREPVARAWVP